MCKHYEVVNEISSSYLKRIKDVAYSDAKYEWPLPQATDLSYLE